jgi:hypothetical protein
MPQIFITLSITRPRLGVEGILRRMRPIRSLALLLLALTGRRSLWPAACWLGPGAGGAFAILLSFFCPHPGFQLLPLHHLEEPGQTAFTPIRHPVFEGWSVQWRQRRQKLDACKRHATKPRQARLRIAAQLHGGVRWERGLGRRGRAVHWRQRRQLRACKRHATKPYQACSCLGVQLHGQVGCKREGVGKLHLSSLGMLVQNPSHIVG